MLVKLQRLLDNPPVNQNCGICYHLVDKQNLFLYIAQWWDKHSGVYNFPIPGTSYKFAEDQYMSKDSKWVGEPLALRLELIRFVYDWYSKAERTEGESEGDYYLTVGNQQLLVLQGRIDWIQTIYNYKAPNL